MYVFRKPMDAFWIPMYVFKRPAARFQEAIRVLYEYFRTNSLIFGSIILRLSHVFTVVNRAEEFLIEIVSFPHWTNHTRRDDVNR